VFAAGDEHWFEALRESDISPVDLEAEANDTPRPRLAKRTRSRRYVDAVAPSQIGSSRQIRLADRLLSGDKDAKAYGSLMHLWLSQLTWLGGAVDLPSDESLLALAGPFADATELTEALKTFKAGVVADPLAGVLSKDLYLADLRTRLANLPDELDLEVRREQRVAGRIDSVVVAGTVDRLVIVRSAGRIVAADVIDYKSASAGQQSNDSEARKAEFYQPQLDAYRRVLSISLRLDLSQVGSRVVLL
jgi:ATP-dependent exoDNAse (exonuclease V) beta subunit